MEVANDVVEGRRNRVTLIAFLVLLFLLLWGAYTMVAPYLLAVVMGAILSILFRKTYLFLLSKGFGPKAAAFCIIVGATFLIILPVVGFTIMATTQGIEAARNLSANPHLSLEALSKYVSHWKPLNSLLGNAAAVEAEVRESLKKVATLAPAVVFKFFGGLPEFILQVVVALLSAYFFLIDGKRFLNWMQDKIPLDPEVRGAVFRSFKETALSAIASTCSAAIVQTIIVSLGFIILGVPTAFLAGLATFFLAWVPIIGSSPVWLGGSIYLFANGFVGKGIAMLGVGICTALSDNIVHPLVLKGRAHMHPLVSLVAIFGGIQLFGLLGVFIGPIVAALVIAVLNIWPVIAERYGFQKACKIVTDSAMPVCDPTQTSSLIIPPPAP